MTYLIPIGRRLQRILRGQHGRRDHDADQYHVAEVVVIAEPVAENAKPTKRDCEETRSR